MSDADEREIRALVTRWATAGGDVGAVLDLMAPDVVFLGAGRPPMIGREAYAAASAQMTGMHIESNNDIRELVISGDMAFCWCDLNVTITLPSGDRVRRVGPVLSVLRRYPDGHWRIARDANMLTVADALPR